jgi:hypothetical protein
MDELTPEQEANFKATAELTEETYEKAFFRSSEEKQASDIRKFGAKYGFDVTRVGISPEAEATQEEKKEEGYGF